MLFDFDFFVQNTELNNSFIIKLLNLMSCRVLTEATQVIFGKIQIRLCLQRP